MCLYIVRHADPVYGTDSVTDEGRREADALAEYMQHEGITDLFCSTKGRAIATANPIVQKIFGIDRVPEQNIKNGAKNWRV